MFYRYTKYGRIPVDFDDTYSGSVFIAGGSPVLLQENLEQLNQPGINVLSLNNTAATVPTTIWLGGDKPKCYSPRILLDSRIPKFAVISRRDFMVQEKQWKTLPNTYFFGTQTDFTVQNLLNPHRDFVWWKNTFYIAIQMAYRLGFRKIYLVGCQFKIDKDNLYSYNMNLTEDQINWNKRTYNSVVEKMKQLKPHFQEKGLEIISCTPESPLNEHFPTMLFDEAVQEVIKNIPVNYDTEKCVHSSVFKEKK